MAAGAVTVALLCVATAATTVMSGAQFTRPASFHPDYTGTVGYLVAHRAPGDVHDRPITEHGLHGKSLPGLGMLMIDGPEDSHHVAANGSGKQQVRASEPARAAYF